LVASLELAKLKSFMKEFLKLQPEIICMCGDAENYVLFGEFRCNIYELFT
jgi:hypothetical protein